MHQLRLWKTEVLFERPRLEDPSRAVREQLLAKAALFPKAASIAIAAGSRGIANIDAIVRSAVAALKDLGAKPFIIPAMGSHGGATAEGQAELLASFGITEPSVGAPIRSSMEAVELKQNALPHKLYMDRAAFESDGIILINRIKPHTDFHGKYESGLIKMAVIGLGKEHQALEMHRFNVHGLRDLVPKAAERVLGTGKILAGIGIVENAYDETALIEVISGGEILSRELELLELAKRNMPQLPVDDIDVLLVDRLGKNISGTGMDTNIIGRIRIGNEPEPAKPRIKAIIVDDLTEQSHGNATGMGLADVVTRRFYNKIDFPVTYRNIITSAFFERGKLPLVIDTAAEAYTQALRSCGYIEPGAERIVRIRDTLHVSEIFVSDAIARDLKHRPDIRVSGEPSEMFHSNGGFIPFE